ncbi:MAG: hypothetical protein QF561_07685 [Phycisphaerales bacterium]|jgi:hypothetical protein|nr:hypothetical protein [Phycisphaerales bacterium]
MSENLILEWATSLSPCARRGLESHLRDSPGSEASTILMRYAAAVDLSVGELSALLPGVLVCARQAARWVVADGSAATGVATAG